MIGQVYKAQTDRFTVKCQDKLIKCNARGLLKKRGNEILVGDFVEVEKGVILNVLERKNRFIRPSVSNVDVVVLLVSPEPKPDYYLIDKVLLNSIKEGTEVIVVINKTDVDESFYNEFNSEYKNLNLDVVKISALNLVGVEELKEKLKGKLSVLVGQSAVGKTTLINSMFNLNMKTGELSNIGRGKHTTTRSEIFEYGKVKVVDSPGFAVIDANVSAEELPEYYEEYFELSSKCKFRGCKHVDEPDCEVKRLVLSGDLPENRYKRYVEIYTELLNRRKIYE